MPKKRDVLARDKKGNIHFSTDLILFFINPLMSSFEKGTQIATSGIPMVYWEDSEPVFMTKDNAINFVLQFWDNPEGIVKKLQEEIIKIIQGIGDSSDVNFNSFRREHYPEFVDALVAHRPELMDHALLAKAFK